MAGMHSTHKYIEKLIASLALLWIATCTLRLSSCPRKYEAVDAQDDNSPPDTPTTAGGGNLHITYFVGSQFSNNSGDGVGEIAFTYSNDPYIYSTTGPGCCNTGFSYHGQKLLTVSDVFTQYYQSSHTNLNIFPTYELIVDDIPSLFEWSQDAVCQKCLMQNPSAEGLWLGTTVASSMLYTSRQINKLSSTDSASSSSDLYMPIMIGPTYSAEAIIITLALQFNVIFIGYSTPDFDRSVDPNGYSNFFNVVPNHDYPFVAASVVINYLKWYNQLTIIHVNETWSNSLAANIYNLIDVKDSVNVVEVQQEYYSMLGAIKDVTNNTDANRIIVLIGRTTNNAAHQSVATVRNPVYGLMCLLSQFSFDVKNQNALVVLPEQSDDLLVTDDRGCYVTQPNDLSDCDCSVASMNKVNCACISTCARLNAVLCEHKNCTNFRKI